MAKIIKEGKYQNKRTCDSCGCEFEFFDSEIETEILYYPFDYLETIGYRKEVECPFCKTRILLHQEIYPEKETISLWTKFKNLFKKED